MNITILTPDREVFKGAIKSVSVPGIGGEFQILERHAPVVSALKNGRVSLDRVEGGKMTFSIQKGFIEVLNNEISLLVQGVKE